MRCMPSVALPQANAAAELIEREAPLALLEQHLRAAVGGTGHIVFLAGEAGIGKTSLLKAFAARCANADTWWGNCDALETPHPLAPLHDIARSAAVQFSTLLAGSGDRAAVFEAVLNELRQKPKPTLLLIEDAHWADHATLDLIKFLGRRIDRVACLLVVSYRDDEVPTTHPLRRVLGELPPSLITRLALPRLTPAAVERLARNALQSPAGVYSATNGNPFFVTELLRHGPAAVPASVQDLVLARFARLSEDAQAVVRLASLVPAKIERWLIDQLGGNLAAIEESVNAGLLIAASDTLAFRHELARVAVETSLSDPVATALHADLLHGLERSDRAHVSLARLVHHATRARDRAAVQKYAPEAAREAQQRGAHREAAAHFKTALEHSTDKGERVRLLEAYAHESQVIDRLDDAIAARLQLSDLYATDGNVTAEAENLSHLALVYVARVEECRADAASRKAIALLEKSPPSLALARAYRVEAQLRMLNRDCEASVDWSSKAIAMAEQFGNRTLLAASISTYGAALLFLDYPEARVQLHRALDIALDDHLHYIAANIYCNLGSGAGELFCFDESERDLKQAIVYAQRHEIDFYRTYSIAWLGLCEMYRGRWDDAMEHAADAINLTASLRNTSRVMALVALGRVQCRRGDPGAAGTLDEALELALASQTLQRLGPVRAARAEAAWWRGDVACVVAEAEAMLKLATDRRHPWFAGEFAYWMWRTGELTNVPGLCADPFALEIAGQWREAARAWATIGCPFEEARALSEGDAPAQIRALEIFEQLGARPAANHMREQLKARGQRKLPRRGRPSTKANPHQLTAREIEVLRLLCEGLKNSEIAERLCRSVRTVDHHLEAVFAKLNVTTRTEAVTAAMRAGIGRKDGQRRAAI